MLAGTLAGVEMGLMKSKIPYKKGGILKALDYLCQTNKKKLEKFMFYNLSNYIINISIYLVELAPRLFTIFSISDEDLFFGFFSDKT